MDIFLIIAMILVNIVSIVIVYQILKKQPKKEILIFIASGVAIIYFIISLIYWLSGFDVEKGIHENAKNFIVFMFVPINVILFMPYSAIQYKKMRQNKKIEKYDIENLSKKVTIMIIIFLIISIGEFFYFKNIQNNIRDMQIEANNITENTITNNVTNNTSNTILDEVTKNVIENSTNTTTNNVVDNSSNVISNEITNKINEV